MASPKPPKFADKTTVPIDRTKSEIEQILIRYGADQYQVASDWSTNRFAIQFRCQSRMIRYLVEMPHAGQYRTKAAHAQAERSKWRAVMNIIKAKLIAVDAQISTFEEEFLANVVTPDGQTVADLICPQLAVARERGEMPRGLLALPAPEKFQ
jgi:hypothetical protein